MTASRRRIARKACRAACIAGWWLGALANPAVAYFDEVAVDSRLVAMGNAGQAEATGVSAYHWNPAGLAQLEGYGVLLDHARPYAVPDLAANAVVAGGRVLDAGVAVGWHRLGIAEAYAEDLFFVAAGREFLSLPSGHTLSAGATLKLGRIAFQPFTVEGTGAAEDYGSRTAGSVDAGARWTTPWRLMFAWVVRDPTRPDYTFDDVEGVGKVPARHEFAVSYRWNQESTLLGSWSALNGNSPSNLCVGLEVRFYNVFAIRSGLSNLSEISRPDGFRVSDDQFRYTGGIGIMHRGWQIDATAVTHRELGASYRVSLGHQARAAGRP